jgi:hypothetical protein
VIEGLEQAEPLADFAEQQGGGGEPTAREIGDDRFGVVSGNGYLGLAEYLIHSRRLQMESVSPAAIAGVPRCQ